MGILIDAGILAEAERGRLDKEPHVARRAEEESFLSVITASELLHGVQRAVKPQRRARRSAFAPGHARAVPPSGRGLDHGAGARAGVVGHVGRRHADRGARLVACGHVYRARTHDRDREPPRV